MVLANPFLPPPVRQALEAAFTAAMDVAAVAQALISALDALRNSIFGGPLCNAIADLSNWAAANDHFEVLRYVSDSVLAQQQSAQSVTGISYAIMDLHDYLDVGCAVVGDSLEVFFDASSPNLVVGFVEQLFKRMSELENGSLTGGQPGAFAGYVSLRFMSQSAALIAMQKFPRTCAIEIAGCGNVHGAESFLAQVELDAVAMGGTVHWGQRNDLTMAMVEHMFNATGPMGALFRWRKALSALSQNGRFPTFSTDFTRQRGLEVVQPLVGSFAINPTSGCAGSLLHVTWTASDNPPGTVATLEIQPAGSPSTTIQLGALDGAQDVPLPAGNTDLTLQVALTVNGRTLTDSRTIQVQGFPASDTRTIDQTATCLLIGGLLHWGVAVTFTPSMAPTELTVEELDSAFLPSFLGTEWYVRKAGMPDIPFSWLAQKHTFAIRPELQGTWTFFLKNAGCPGLAPQLHATFTVVCT